MYKSDLLYNSFIKSDTAVNQLNNLETKVETKNLKLPYSVLDFIKRNNELDEETDKSFCATFFNSSNIIIAACNVEITQSEDITTENKIIFTDFVDLVKSATSLNPDYIVFTKTYTLSDELETETNNYNAATKLKIPPCIYSSDNFKKDIKKDEITKDTEETTITEDEAKLTTTDNLEITKTVQDDDKYLINNFTIQTYSNVNECVSIDEDDTYQLPTLSKVNSLISTVTSKIAEKITPEVIEKLEPKIKTAVEEVAADLTEKIDANTSAISAINKIILPEYTDSADVYNNIYNNLNPVRIRTYEQIFKSMNQGMYLCYISGTNTFNIPLRQLTNTRLTTFDNINYTVLTGDYLYYPSEIAGTINYVKINDNVITTSSEIGEEGSKTKVIDTTNHKIDLSGYSLINYIEFAYSSGYSLDYSTAALIQAELINNYGNSFMYLTTSTITSGDSSVTTSYIKSYDNTLYYSTEITGIKFIGCLKKTNNNKVICYCTSSTIYFVNIPSSGDATISSINISSLPSADTNYTFMNASIYKNQLYVLYNYPSATVTVTRSGSGGQGGQYTGTVYPSQFSYVAILTYIYSSNTINISSIGSYNASNIATTNINVNNINDIAYIYNNLSIDCTISSTGGGGPGSKTNYTYIYNYTSIPTIIIDDKRTYEFTKSSSSSSWTSETTTTTPTTSAIPPKSSIITDFNNKVDKLKIFYDNENNLFIYDGYSTNKTLSAFTNQNEIIDLSTLEFTSGSSSSSVVISSLASYGPYIYICNGSNVYVFTKQYDYKLKDSNYFQGYYSPYGYDTPSDIYFDY